MPENEHVTIKALNKLNSVPLIKNKLMIYTNILDVFERTVLLVTDV